jgi:SAM-dependent methyltransferase
VFTDLIPASTAAPAADDLAPRERFLALLGAALREGRLLRASCTLWSGPAAMDPKDPSLQLERLLLRPITLRGETALQFVWRYDRRDTTKNLGLAAALKELAGLIGAGGFASAHAVWQIGAPGEQAPTQEAEFRHRLKGSKDKSHLRLGKPELAAGATASATPNGTSSAEQPVSTPLGNTTHDRPKHRELSLDLPFWVDLGLTTLDPASGRARLVPAMARKWKQINHFLEVVGAAFDKAEGQAGQRHVRVLDFGSGKGYLTFAMHAWLLARGHTAEVIGVELRSGLVDLCNAAARRHGCTGLSFSAGDVQHYDPAPVDLMIALHACDTATDHAIHLGLRAGARLIVCSPCCHKQLRPQMKSPALLAPMLRHGIHLGQQAEMVTDSLRALLLDAEGYEPQVFEFVALEHTSKNKMILATARPEGHVHRRPAHRAEVLAQVEEIKRFYGVGEHCLQALLAAGERDTATATASA